MREQITNYLQKCESAGVKEISQVIEYGIYETRRELNRMVADGLLVCSKRRNEGFYGLTDNFIKGKDRIIAFLKENPNSSAKEIAAGAKVEPEYACAVLVDLHKAGRVTRTSKPVTKVWIYTHAEPTPFGCGNSMTVMFNSLLRQAREARA